MHLPPRVVAAAAIPIWVALGACGLLLLARYNAAPGREAPAPAQWPEGSDLVHARDRPALVVFAHPECPCTRATLAVLSEIASEDGERCDIQVVISEDVPDPATSENADRARTIPGVRVVVDRGHAEARRFGALTSGFTVLYDRDGRLRFAGGITDARGHPGPSIGRTQIAAVLRGRPASDAAPTFGCDLGGDAAP